MLLIHVHKNQNIQPLVVCDQLSNFSGEGCNSSSHFTRDKFSISHMTENIDTTEMPFCIYIYIYIYWHQAYELLNFQYKSS